MNKIFKFLFSIFLMAIFAVNVNAACTNEELNEWATKVKATFTENPKPQDSDSSQYAYFLSITPLRDDIRFVVTDGSGNSAASKDYTDVNIYGVGAYTNLEEETYTIKVYGASNSACPNELLKTVKYTVPRFNRRVKDARCEENPDLDVCKTYTNLTKDMTDKEFNEIVSKTVKENKEYTKSDIIKMIIGYGLFIIVPFLVISIIYIRKIRKVKKEERNR